MAAGSQDPREDLRARRQRLRLLDGRLLGEIEFVGALTERELQEALTSAPALKELKLSPETVAEWWTDAQRRQLIGAPSHTAIAGDLALTDRGASRLESERELNRLSGKPILKLLVQAVQFTFPSVLAIAAIAALAEKNAEVAAQVAAFAAVGVVALLFAAGLNLLFSPIWSRFAGVMDRYHAGWLEGRPVRALRGWRFYKRLPELNSPPRLPPAPGHTALASAEQQGQDRGGGGGDQQAAKRQY